MGDINGLIIANVRKCSTLLQILKLYDLIWDRTDGDRHLLNLAVIRESSHFGHLPYPEWIDSFVITRVADSDEYVCITTHSDYAIFLRETHQGSIYIQLNKLYTYVNHPDTTPR